MAQNAIYVLDYKQKAEEAGIPEEDIIAKYMEFQL